MNNFKFKKRNVFSTVFIYIFALSILCILIVAIPYLVFWSLNVLFSCSFDLTEVNQYIAFWILITALSLFFEHVGRRIGKALKEV